MKDQSAQRARAWQSHALLQHSMVGILRWLWEDTLCYASTFHAAFVAMVDHSLVADELVSDHQEGLTLRLDITLPSWKHVHHSCYGSRLSTFMSPTLPRDQIHEWLDSDIVMTNSTRVTFDFARQCHYGEFTFWLPTLSSSSPQPPGYMGFLPRRCRCSPKQTRRLEFVGSQIPWLSFWIIVTFPVET